MLRTLGDLTAEREVAVQLAERGAEIALRFQRSGPKVLRTREKPLGAGPVTAADEAVDAHLVHGLRAAFPDDDIVAEESHRPDHSRAAPRCWFVDPIDGTREFAQGTGGWTVQLGLCIGGEPVLGVVAEPRYGRLSWAMRTTDGWASQSLTPNGTHELQLAQRPWPAIELIGGSLYPGGRQHAIRTALGVDAARVRAVGSVGVRMTSVARGVADLYVQAPGKTKMWDTCAPAALVLAAGGCVLDLRGQPLEFADAPITHAYGVLACSPVHLRHAQRALEGLVSDWL